MCGICGKVNFNMRPVDAQALYKLLKVLKHRGPDDEGVYLNGNIGLGHRRLSIIDLSKAGHQPMPNEDGTIWLICNGEIYNFTELKKRLEEKKHIFRSHSDAEVILHLYEDKGKDCIQDLRGMFAFAIWDQNKKRLFLARDRIGKKPLFYSFTNGNLVFASELSALLEDNGISKDIDFASLDEFLQYQYIPAPHSIFSQINKLPPAHFLTWEKGEIEICRYWNLDYSHKLKLREEEYAERILELLMESTRIRLASDVPLGAFLSGGIDSSAIVAVMSELINRPVATFSIGFEDRSFDETAYARLVSKIFGTEHREFIVKPDTLEILPELIRHFGEPYADSSAIPAYYLSKLTRQHVTVALNGDAGDESFGGYERYIATKIAEQYRIPSFLLNKFFAKIIRGIPESTHKKDRANRIKRFLDSAILGRENRYLNLVSVFNTKEKKQIYSEFMENEIKHNSRENIILKEYKNSNTSDLIDATLYTDLMTAMPGDLLPKIDITTMANSLEARSPFLDHKFLEFTAQIPSSLKIKGFTTKYILKKALKRILPRNILQREKMGFGVPIGRWFRDELKNYAYEILLSDQCIKRGYFKKEIIKQILDRHTSGKANYANKIWSLLNLELWHRTFIDKEKI